MSEVKIGRRYKVSASKGFGEVTVLFYTPDYGGKVLFVSQSGDDADFCNVVALDVFEGDCTLIPEELPESKVMVTIDPSDTLINATALIAAIDGLRLAIDNDNVIGLINAAYKVVEFIPLREVTK